MVGKAEFDVVFMIVAGTDRTYDFYPVSEVGRAYEGEDIGLLVFIQNIGDADTIFVKVSTLEGVVFTDFYGNETDILEHYMEVGEYSDLYDFFFKFVMPNTEVHLTIETGHGTGEGRVVDQTIEALISVFKKYLLEIISYPEGVNFSIGGVLYTTPWSDSIFEGTYLIEMPQNIIVEEGTLEFESWEDGATSPIRDFTLISKSSLIATYAFVPPPFEPEPEPEPEPEICKDYILLRRAYLFAVEMGNQDLVERIALTCEKLREV